jgi:ribosomal protein S18 acetylase RimI-like enzyme
MPEEITYTLRSIEPSDADAIQRLWRARFGGDPSTQEPWIDAVLNEKHSATATIVASSTAGDVVGFGILEVGDEAYTRRYLSLDAIGLDPGLARQNGLFHMYCVRRDWEGQGIGSALYARHLDLLDQQGAEQAFGISWHRPRTKDSRVLFDKYGFRRLATVERYYERFEERPHCPDCSGTCTCSASLYARTIDVG